MARGGGYYPCCQSKHDAILEVFGVEEGNGLSPFAGDINTPEELLSLVKDFFRPPKRD